MSERVEYSSITDCLEDSGQIAVTVSGYSMYPMLRNRRDCVVCRKYSGGAVKYDVLLYKNGEKLVLHRVISNEKKDGKFIIRGDNCLLKEYIPEENVYGILTDFTRNNRDYTVNDRSYRLYSRLIVFFHPVVGLKIKAKAWIRSVIKKLKGR